MDKKNRWSKKEGNAFKSAQIFLDPNDDVKRMNEQPKQKIFGQSVVFAQQ